jgi:hypothetical protein
MSNWWCDAESPSNARHLQDQCPGGGIDSITGEVMENPMVFFCDSGEYTPIHQRKHMKCYDKSTIREMYRNRGSVPFVEPTSRGRFTNNAMQKIRGQLGVGETIIQLPPSPRPYRPANVLFNLVGPYRRSTSKRRYKSRRRKSPPARRKSPKKKKSSPARHKSTKRKTRRKRSLSRRRRSSSRRRH